MRGGFLMEYRVPNYYRGDKVLIIWKQRWYHWYDRHTVYMLVVVVDYSSTDIPGLMEMWMPIKINYRHALCSSKGGGGIIFGRRAN